MRISVIVPVYNVERYLARCLDSVLAAAGEAGCETEIICVNDGSTDGSAAILARYADRVKIIVKENGGLGSARNAGLDVMTGEYVAFVDSDDWIPRHALRRFVEVAAGSQAALVVSTSFLKDDGGGGVKAGEQGPSRWRMRTADWIAGRKVQYSAWNKLYRASLFKGRRYPATIYEDFPVTTCILAEVGEFAAIDEPLYVYCLNAGATSLVRSKFTERKMRDSLTVVRLALEGAEGKRLAGFVLGQAADGLSSTVGQVYKARDREIAAAFLTGLERLAADFPAVMRRLTLKARFRLWRIRAQVKGAA